MKAELQIDLTFDQILSIVKQLSRQQKIKLSKELEKEGIETKLTSLLQIFRTDELSLETLTEEIESVRQEIYAQQKH